MKINQKHIQLIWLLQKHYNYTKTYDIIKLYILHDNDDDMQVCKPVIKVCSNTKVSIRNSSLSTVFINLWIEHLQTEEVNQ